MQTSNNIHGKQLEKDTIGNVLKVEAAKFLNTSLRYHGRDSSTITDELVASNVEDALLQSSPYLKQGQISFEDFCEYVLPYRNGNEEPESWRQKVREYYAKKLNSAKTSNKNIAQFVSTSLLHAYPNTHRPKMLSILFC